MRLDDWGDRSTFHEVDYLGNANLLDAAQKVGVRKFVYISLAGGPELRTTAYADAHERFVDRLAESGLPFSIVRPTGLFSFFAQVFDIARRGRGVLVGDGSSKTNPLHPGDAARACVDALSSEIRDLPIGGPLIYTRRQITELAFAALGRAPHIRSIPFWAVRPIPALIRIANPRIAALMQFGIAISERDVIAPRYGHQKLPEYFRMLAAGQYDTWHSPVQGSSFSATSKPTTSGNGSSHARSNTKSFSAGR
jgi:uncharacterized protein YbjT (DUF2867 family)